MPRKLLPIKSPGSSRKSAASSPQQSFPSPTQGELGTEMNLGKTAPGKADGKSKKNKKVRGSASPARRRKDLTMSPETAPEEGQDNLQDDFGGRFLGDDSETQQTSCLQESPSNQKFERGQRSTGRSPVVSFGSPDSVQRWQELDDWGPKARRERLSLSARGGGSPLGRHGRRSPMGRQVPGILNGAFTGPTDVPLVVEYDTLMQALSRRLSDCLSILPDDHLEHLADWAEVFYFETGENVFAQGERDEASQEMWILIDGFVEGSFKPGMKDSLEALPSSGLIGDLTPSPEAQSDDVMKGKKLRRKPSMTKKASKKSETESKEPAFQDSRKILEHKNNSIKASNDAITPVQLFATRAFGAAFGDETLFSGDRRNYSVFALTQSKLCKITLENYTSIFDSGHVSSSGSPLRSPFGKSSALGSPPSSPFFSSSPSRKPQNKKSFLTQHLRKIPLYQRSLINQSFRSTSGSLIFEFFPEDFQQRLQDVAVLRRLHAGQQIMAPLAPGVQQQESWSSQESFEIQDGIEDSKGDNSEHPTGKNQDILEPEEPDVFILVSGKIEIVGYDEEGGRKIVSGHDASGCIFGELTAIMSYERLVGASASNECQICVFPKTILREMISELMARKNFSYKIRTHVTKESELLVDAMAKSMMWRQTSDLYTEAIKRSRSPLHDARVSVKQSDGDEDGDNREQENKQGTGVIETSGIQPRELSEKLVLGPMEMAINKAEACMLEAESVLMKAHQSNDWPVFYKDVVNKIEGTAQRYYEILAKHGQMFPLQGFDSVSLEKKLARLDLMLLQVTARIPPGLLQTERMKRCTVTQQILKAQKDFGRCVLERYPKVDFRSSTVVCKFMDRALENVTHLEEQTAKFRQSFLKRFGEDAGSRLFSSIHKWYERKWATWTRCHQLHEHHNLFIQKIADLERQSKNRTLLEYEIFQMGEFRYRSVETLRILERIREDLLPVNRAVVQTCFRGLPPPPTAAVASSPLLSFVLHLQRVIEMREDLRIAKGFATIVADAMMQQSIKECCFDPVTEPIDYLSIEQAMSVGRPSTNEVVPLVGGFLVSLGSWLFTRDIERWERENRKARKIRGFA